MGVLIYFMLQNELPFGSWRDSELDIFAKVAGGQLLIPDGLGPEVSDLLNKVKLVLKFVLAHLCLFFSRWPYV